MSKDVVAKADQLPDVPDLLPARMLNQFTYCNRLGYLEWVQGEFVESVDTLKGTFLHRRVDKKSGNLPPPEDLEDAPDLTKIRSITLSSERVGLIAKIDLLEVESGQVVPIDYKKGHNAPGPDAAWTADKVQLAAQAIVLRDNGYTCQEGIIYYIASQERVPVAFNASLMKDTEEQIEAFRSTCAAGRIPEPLEDSPKCSGCSLASICLPDEIHLLTRHNTPTPKHSDVRRFHPQQDHALPLYVVEQGASIGKQNDILTIKKHGDILNKVRLREVSQVCVFGNVNISTQCIRSLMAQNIPVSYFSYGGWFSGTAHPLTHKNIELRLQQFEAATTTKKSVDIARQIVAGKIKNSRILLRRNHENLDTEVLDDLARLRRKTFQCTSLQSLLGLEGAAARTYFSHFSGMLKPKDAWPAFGFNQRNRRPPKDEVNALLSFGYSMLVKDLTAIVMSMGFDPYLGFYHQPKYGRPALALDLAEEFRSLVADSVVISVINTGQIRVRDFIRRGEAVALTNDGRKRFLAAYERRMQTCITHPIFRYSISYRRIMHVQARLLARHIAGEIASYPPFFTR